MKKSPDLLNCKLSRLQVVGRERSTNGKLVWKCICDCGKEVEAVSADLTLGRIKSCGCLNKDNAKIKAIAMGKANKVLLPREASAKLVFHRTYNDGNISYDNFINLSQMNCYYCDQSPLNKTNRYGVIGGEFIYNGLDRIDSSLTHLLSNVVPCCKHCNWAKNSLSLFDFKLRILNMFKFRLTKYIGTYLNINIKDFKLLDIKEIPFKKRGNSPQFSALRNAWQTLKY